MEVTADGLALARVYTDARSVLLTGRAAAKEVRFAQESPANQKKILIAMAREWSKWEEFKATTPLSSSELGQLRHLHPDLRIIGTRWVLTVKDPSFKAWLVVKGCQEDPTELRCDSPTGSRDAQVLHYRETS